MANLDAAVRAQEPAQEPSLGAVRACSVLPSSRRNRLKCRRQRRPNPRENPCRQPHPYPRTTTRTSSQAGAGGTRRRPPWHEEEVPAAAQGKGGRPMGRGDSARGDRMAKPAFSQRDDDRGRGSAAPDAPRLGDVSSGPARGHGAQRGRCSKKLASQAHGEALTPAAELLGKPGCTTGCLRRNQLGPRVSAQDRCAVAARSFRQPANRQRADPASALLRLEIAAECPRRHSTWPSGACCSCSC